MCTHQIRLTAVACLVCFVSLSCKPQIEEREPPAKPEAPKTTTQAAATETPLKKPSKWPPFPAGTILDREGEIKISRGATWQADKAASERADTDLLPGDHLQIPPGASATLKIRRLGLVKMASESQVRFPDHAACGIEHWEGSLSLEGPPFFEPKHNNCWVHTPTASIFSGKGTAEIHVAPGGQTLVHNHNGTLLLADHDGVVRKIAPGESATVEWSKTSVSATPAPDKKVSTFLKGHPLDPQTVEQILNAGKSWSTRFEQVFRIAVDLADQQRSITMQREEFAKLGKQEATKKAKEIQQKLGPLLPRRYEAEQKLTIIYNRMNHIKRLTAPTDPEAFASFDAMAATAIKKFPRIFRFGPSPHLSRFGHAKIR